MARNSVAAAVKSIVILLGVALASAMPLGVSAAAKCPFSPLPSSLANIAKSDCYKSEKPNACCKEGAKQFIDLLTAPDSKFSSVIGDPEVNAACQTDLLKLLPLPKSAPKDKTSWAQLCPGFFPLLDTKAAIGCSINFERVNANKIMRDLKAACLNLGVCKDANGRKKCDNQVVAAVKSFEVKDAKKCRVHIENKLMQNAYPEVFQMFVPGAKCPMPDQKARTPPNARAVPAPKPAPAMGKDDKKGNDPNKRTTDPASPPLPSANKDMKAPPPSPAWKKEPGSKNNERSAVPPTNSGAKEQATTPATPMTPSPPQKNSAASQLVSSIHAIVGATITVLAIIFAY